jgi:hypothetical protein
LEFYVFTVDTCSSNHHWTKRLSDFNYWHNIVVVARVLQSGNWHTTIIIIIRKHYRVASALASIVVIVVTLALDSAASGWRFSL